MNKMIRSATVLLVTLWVPSFSWAVPNPEVEQLILEGVALSNAKKYDLAIPLLSQAIEKQPDHAGAYLNRGIAYYFKGATLESISDLSRSIQIQPTALAYYNLGEAYFAQKSYEEAIEPFSKSLEMEPKNGYALLDRGVAYLEIGEPKKAFADFDQIINTIAKIQNAYFYRGLAQYRMGSAKASISDFTLAINLGDDDFPANSAMAYLYRGKAKMDSKDSEGATEDFRTAATLDNVLLPEAKALLNQIKAAKQPKKKR